ncbi:hypothetical protein BO94DRAFT_582311 [Aspergillus sclerotioniger CBS 115572]|uniref:DNA2/NAM7 helicase-like C-terminal domain-containing protein n=1 Tax=Aspergillus sclerotioniger CBS 115572 TaxID=1450535 RepID=A0A317X8H4_9EURO|nr:hypothetical protein BO94DRAFT_582311 [Aspergillus sclerotioniger CBS 115572]PWY93887.1 hypothetical protein BO94DRAFT_582311 [Aspergillus sclerotioniger CBS 115572]
MFAFAKVVAHVVQQANLLVCTNNTAGSPIVASNFGRNAKSIILIRDEVPKEVELNSWIPIACLRSGAKVIGMVISGDLEQPQPTVLSAQDDPVYNGFALQLQLSFFRRATKMNHPVTKLTEQRRFRDAFVGWLNKRIYNSMMKSHVSTQGLTIDPRWDAMVRDLYDLNYPLDTGNIVLSIEGSEAFVDPHSKSRLNHNILYAVISLILCCMESTAYLPTEITVICLYKAQKVLYLQALHKLIQANVLRFDALPCIETADSIQGKENRVIIVDWVVSSASKKSDLGFTIDDSRGNVAQSRMREVMVNIVPSTIGSDALSTNDQERNGPRRDLKKKKLPYLCEYVQYAAAHRMIIEVSKDRVYDHLHPEVRCFDAEELEEPKNGSVSGVPIDLDSLHEVFDREQTVPVSKI